MEVRVSGGLYLDNSRSTTSTELLIQASMRPVRELPSRLLMSKVVLLPPMIPGQDFLFLFRILETTLTSPSRQQVRNISAVLAAEAIFVRVKCEAKPSLSLSYLISHMLTGDWNN